MEEALLNSKSTNDCITSSDDSLLEGDETDGHATAGGDDRDESFDSSHAVEDPNRFVTVHCITNDLVTGASNSKCGTTRLSSTTYVQGSGHVPASEQTSVNGDEEGAPLTLMLVRNVRKAVEFATSVT